MNKKNFKGVLLVLMVLTMTLFAVGMASAASNNVLLVQDYVPWGDGDANANVLESLGYNYSITPMSGVADTNLADYKLVIMANGQSNSFYDGYAANQTKFESFVKSGGTLLFGCAEYGYFDTNAPGGVEFYRSNELYNYIVDYENPVVTGELTDNNALTDADLVGNSCSHDLFVEDTLPNGTKIILRGYNSDAPTLVMYKYGKGKVVGSGLTWEAGYNWDWGYGTKALDDLFAYAMSLGKYVSSGHDPLPGHTSFSSHAGFDH